MKFKIKTYHLELKRNNLVTFDEGCAPINYARLSIDFTDNRELESVDGLQGSYYFLNFYNCSGIKDLTFCSKIKRIDTLSMSSSGITSLKGLSDEIEIKELSCRDTNITKLDYQSANIYDLILVGSNLKTLDGITGFKGLQRLDVTSCDWLSPEMFGMIDLVTLKRLHTIKIFGFSRKDVGKIQSAIRTNNPKEEYDKILFQYDGM